jgi:hypothetical protein
VVGMVKARDSASMALQRDNDPRKQSYVVMSPWPTPKEQSGTQISAVLTITETQGAYTYKVDLQSKLVGSALPSKATYYYAVNIIHSDRKTHRFYLTGLDTCSKDGIFIGLSQSIEAVQLELIN